MSVLTRIGRIAVAVAAAVFLMAAVPQFSLAESADDGATELTLRSAEGLGPAELPEQPSQNGEGGAGDGEGTDPGPTRHPDSVPDDGSGVPATGPSSEGDADVGPGGGENAEGVEGTDPESGLFAQTGDSAFGALFAGALAAAVAVALIALIAGMRLSAIGSLIGNGGCRQEKPNFEETERSL